MPLIGWVILAVLAVKWAVLGWCFVQVGRSL